MGASPTQLWETDPSNAGSFNDVSIDATGKMVAAVAADESGTNFQDQEVFAWDLAAAKTSSSPVMQDDPQQPQALQLTAPEGMGVAALAPAPGGKADLLAVGQEGSSGQSSAQNNIWVYRISRGGETRQQAAYPGNMSAPDGRLNSLHFSENARFLLAEHPGEITLFRQASGTQYNAIDTWSAGDKEILDIAVSKDLDRIIVSTLQDPGVGQDTYRLHLLSLDRSVSPAELTAIADPIERTVTGDGQFTAVDIDDAGRLVVAGTQDSVVFYYELQESQDPDEAGEYNFSTPWTQSRSQLGAVTEVAISGNGELFAAGFGGGHLAIYQQSDLEPEGPLAVPAISEPFETSGAPRTIQWANQDTTLYVQASTVYSFNVVQFDTNEPLTPLWAIPGATDFAASRDGHRFILALGQTVSAYEQAYKAELDLQGAAEVTPGEQTSLSLEITNTGSAFDEYTVSLEDAPPSWTVEVSPPRISVLPGRTATATLNLTPPASQAPGTVTLEAVATSRFAPGEAEAGASTLSLEVPEVHAAGLDVDDRQVDVTRSQTAEIPVTLTNRGNVADGIVLEVDQQRDWTISLDGEQASQRTFQIPAATDQPVTVSLEVPSSASEGSSNQLTLTARPEGGGPESSITVLLLVEPDYGAALAGPTSALEAEPGEQLTAQITLSNTGNTQDSYTLRAYSNATNDLFWEARLSNTAFDLDAGRERTISVTVNVPRGASPGDGTTVEIVAVSAGTGDQAARVQFDARVPTESDDTPLPLLLTPIALGLAGLARRRRR